MKPVQALVMLSILGLFLRPTFASNLYANTYSNFAAACVVTQKKQHGEKPEENWGHIVYFLNKTCVQNGNPTPRLRDCPEKNDGTWISVNAMFKNVNWIAVEGWDFGLRGTLKSPSEKLTAEVFKATSNKLQASGVFKNLEYYESEVKKKPEAMSLPDYFAKKSLDMDFAITFGRNVSCAFVPITPEQRVSMISFLNERQEFYSNPTKKAFQWSGFHNNCAHMTNNVLAAAGVLPDTLDFETNFFSQLFNLGIPSQVFLKTSEISDSSEDLRDPLKIIKNEYYWRLLDKYSWLPLRHGVLVESFPVVPDNDLYETQELGLFYLTLNPRSSSMKNRALNRAVEIPVANAKQNLARFEQIYRDSLVKTQELLKQSSPLHARLEVYAGYLKSQIEDTVAKQELEKKASLNLKTTELR